jgi:hypothetical protein
VRGGIEPIDGGIARLADYFAACISACNDNATDGNLAGGLRFARQIESAPHPMVVIVALMMAGGVQETSLE